MCCLYDSMARENHRRVYHFITILYSLDLMFSNHCFREDLSVLVKYKHDQPSVIMSMCTFWIKALFLFGLQTTLLDKYLRKMGVGELEMKVDFHLFYEYNPCKKKDSDKCLVF